MEMNNTVLFIVVNKLKTHYLNKENLGLPHYSYWPPNDVGHMLVKIELKLGMMKILKEKENLKF
ncbi:hypothetical protein BpHYR1_045318 [Brachionus plicatilis]|uniref:Uncharacterized protein n=1 Tax=Brachionus plicatilis TaxID=10195 RepID=A0A3M7PHU3_BRAPC|nr:hypothetical protein BpHYR1_045318 [Brachionus plicatilis]